MTRRTDNHGRGLSPVDCEALERAIQLTRNSGESGRREQIDHFLATRRWFDVALFCVYSCQFDAISPRLWQPVPSDIDDIEATLAARDDGTRGRFAAAKLLKKMLAAGLSRYEPDPLKALAEAKTRRQAAAEPEPTV